MPQGVVSWSTTKINLFGVVWLTANGQLTPYLLDIVNAKISKGLNGIPFALVTLAVGREVTSGLPANIHYLVDFLKMQLPFQLYAQITELDNSFGIPVDIWPQGPFLIFEGYTVGTGFSRVMNGQANYSLSLAHWLTDMNFSSALSRQTQALNPQQLANAAALVGGVGLLPDFASHTMAFDLFTQQNMSKDFWGQSLRQWLLRICSQDMLTDPDDPFLQANQGQTNIEAKRALNRFEPFFQIGPNGQPLTDPNGNPIPGPYIFGVPLAIDPAQVLQSDAAVESIGFDICAENFDTMASTTLWDKLAGGYCSNYMLAVVPLVQSALVVPFQPGIRTVWQTIYEEEYDAIALHGDLPRTIRGYRVWSGFGDRFGAFGFMQGEAGAQTTIGGSYTNPVLTDGMFRYANAPRWMSNLIPANVFGQQALAPGGIVGNALQPGVGNPLQGLRPGQIRVQARELLNDYAHALYVNEVLKGRWGTIKGKLRFDIALGSSVQIMTNEEKFVEAILGPLVGANMLIGQVFSMTHYLDAEACQASTTFAVGWLRTPLENLSEGTSIDSNPLWVNQWFGAPDIERPEFVPRGNILNFGS
jgi:hypothetical protein